MENKHLKNELQFYRQAFSDNSERRIKKFSWQYNTSASLVGLIKKHKLDKDASSKRVLDAGCGDGRHIEFFRKLGVEVWGVDFSKEAIALCQKRFKGDPQVHLEVVDLTIKNALKNFSDFDIVIDWSVLDHIRMEYRKNYLRNLIGAVKKGGHAIFTEFDTSLPETFSGKKYKISNGHYSRAYSIADLKKTLKPLASIDQKVGMLEDEINNYRFNTVLFKK